MEASHNKHEPVYTPFTKTGPKEGTQAKLAPLKYLLIVKEKVLELEQRDEYGE